jgi:large subunit ribosomal protein L25
MATIELDAVKREKLGGSTAEELRRKGRVPGVVYGHGEASVPFHVKELSLRPLIYTQETHTINLNLDGATTRCILREVQFHPVTDRVRHIDLIALHAGEKIKVDIPIVITGTAAGVKDGGIVDFVLHKLSVEVLPEAIPEHISVDIRDLKIGHSVHVKDLPSHPTYTILGDQNAVIVACVPPKAATETTEVAAAVVTEPEQIQAKGKKEEEA